MKNILVISASPRKGGNSDVLCDEFIKGAQKAGHKVEKIFLRNFKVNYCTGCGVCNSTHKCVQKDDMAEIMDKMVNADVIVFATPVYFYTMDAQLKTLIDRTVPRYTEMVNKEVYYILTAADTNSANLEKTVESIRGFTLDCLDGAVEKGILYGTGVWDKGEVQSSAHMKTAYEMGLHSYNPFGRELALAGSFFLIKNANRDIL